MFQIPSHPHHAICVSTRQGRQIHLISLADLWDPIEHGQRVRAFCHLHGGDKQRSLSIDTCSGWGHCFNAACEATVLVRELNQEVAGRLLRRANDPPPQSILSSLPPQPQRPPTPRSNTPTWQREEATALRSIMPQLWEALSDVDLGDSWQAQAYLTARGIPLELAHASGVGYLPRELLERPEFAPHRAVLQRWTERLIFPLRSPTGNGAIGRALWGWQVGMDEQRHTALLEEPGAARRWIKTNPAGWFCVRPVEFAACVVLVEGTFDRLSLLAAGAAEHEVVALAGIAAPVDWFPSQVRAVVLALDADEGGIDAMLRLADQLEQAGIQAYLCPPPAHYGKDWNECWRYLGSALLAPINEAMRALGYPRSSPSDQ